MSETTQEIQFQNGLQPESEAQPEQQSEVESRPEQQPEPEAHPESEPETKPKEELKPEIASDADPKTEEDKESSIQLNDASKSASTGQVVQPELRKDEGNRTFTMRELLSELKSDEDDAGSPYRYFFLFLFGFSIDK